MKYGISIDINRCTGCQACAVTCMDQNDLDGAPGDPAWRTVFRVEDAMAPASKSYYISIGCMHCSTAPCIAGCPSGALQREDDGMVTVDESVCIGCRTCLSLCPFGAPRFNRAGKMQKCDLCSERIHAGLDPACIRVCPTRALKLELPGAPGL